MHDILSYLAAVYDPIAIILYGSFADGTNTLFSDFDALLITRDGERKHDAGYVDCTQLDVSVRPLADFENGFDPAEYVRLCGGTILLDRNGIAAGLLETVNRFLDTQASKAPNELCSEVEWCEKTLRRAERSDNEGIFRRHQLLAESLPIYCDVCSRRYLGPKKTLELLERKDRKAFALYVRALQSSDPASLGEWIALIRAQFEKKLPLKKAKADTPAAASCRKKRAQPCVSG